MATSQAEGGTRSGLLWEVERILDELERERDGSTLPQILLMENVPEVIGQGNLEDFAKWINKLSSLGYSNYYEILNAKNYGIPQNRRRCFMISILGDYGYEFPFKMKLKYRLKDFLKKQVDEKYYLDEKDLERISSWKAQEKPIENAIDIDNDSDKVMPTLTARGAGEEHSGMKLIKYSDKSVERINKNIVEGNNAPSITANAMQSINHQNCVLIKEQQSTRGGFMIKENNNQGYKLATEGDGVNLASRMKHQRGNVQKGSIQTLKAQMEVGVVVKDESTKT